MKTVADYALPVLPTCAKTNIHIDSDFEDVLREEGCLEQSTAQAVLGAQREQTDGLPLRRNADATIRLAELMQTLVAGNNQLRLGNQCCRDDLVVVRIVGHDTGDVRTPVSDLGKWDIISIPICPSLHASLRLFERFGEYPLESLPICVAKEDIVAMISA